MGNEALEAFVTFTRLIDKHTGGRATVAAARVVELYKQTGGDAKKAFELIRRGIDDSADSALERVMDDEGDEGRDVPPTTIPTPRRSG